VSIINTSSTYQRYPPPQRWSDYQVSRYIAFLDVFAGVFDYAYAVSDFHDAHGRDDQYAQAWILFHLVDSNGSA